MNKKILLLFLILITIACKQEKEENEPLPHPKPENINYNNLAATDALGRKLPSWDEVGDINEKNMSAYFIGRGIHSYLVMEVAQHIMSVKF